MEFKRVVIKIGTSTLIDESFKVNTKSMENIVKVVVDIKNLGVDVVIVTSGAVGIGASILKLNVPVKDTSLRQACASVGQCELMNIYKKLFSKYDFLISQILLTQQVLDKSENEFNTKNTFEQLLIKNVVPIVNANDTMFIKELEFGDNDELSAAVAVLIKASMLIILTDIDGIYNKNPKTNLDAKLIDKISDIDDYIENVVRFGTNMFGTGGMKTKLKAAKTAASKKIPTAILNGRYPERIYNIFKGEVKGTLIDLKNIYNFS